MLAAAIVLVVLVAAAARPDRPVAGLAIAGVALVAAQYLVAHQPRRLRSAVDRDALRMILVLLYLAAANVAIDPQTWPLTSMFLPVVALSAASGRAVMIRVCLAAALIVVAPFIIPTVVSRPLLTPDRAMSLGAAAVILALGTRRTVSALEGALTRLRRVMAADRLRSARLAAVEEVSRLLAADGPTPDALERIMELLEARLGYRFASIYLGGVNRLRLGAQRGYPAPLSEFDGSRGVIGRTMRLRQPQLVRDVTSDPEYTRAVEGIRSEICVPLLAGGDLVGVINVESADELGQPDMALVGLVADRVASALALANERMALSTRAEIFRRLVGFASGVTGSLDLKVVPDQIAGGVRTVVETDGVIVTTKDGDDGAYRVGAVVGLDPALIGASVRPGSGMAGRAILSGGLVVADRWDGDDVRPTDAAAGASLPVAAMAVPLLRDQAVVGAITLVRSVRRPFSPLEQEVAQVLAGQSALAFTNATLMAKVADSALHDPLTGLPNRRFLDATLDRLDATRRRQPPGDRPVLSAILFDLDRFGELNKRHGHQVGDSVLRGFADVINGRLRASDIVARYGGEEFLVVLETTDRDGATIAAEAVRSAFAARVFDARDETIRVTVSAGCASIHGDETIADLIRYADAGLAMAKRAGRNQVVAV
jgi:diguanylate cyclase (GGDEF)-like protein